MKQFDKVLKHLHSLPQDFYGQIIVRIREGRAVLITEEKTVKLDEDGNSMNRALGSQ